MSNKATLFCGPPLSPFVSTSRTLDLSMILTTLAEIELLQTHAGVMAELKNRSVVRTPNNPVGDYTEWLVYASLR